MLSLNHCNFMHLKMKKVLVLFAIFVTFQESHQIKFPSPHFSDVGEIYHEYDEAVKEVNRIIVYISTYLSSFARDYEHEIDNTLDHENIAALVENLQNTIHAIESETESKSCVDAAWRKTKIATDELKTNIDSCVSESRIIGANIEGSLQGIDGKAIRIREEIFKGLRNCLEYSNEVECLNNVIQPIKEEIVLLEKEILATNIDVMKKAAEGIKNLEICLQDTEKDFTLKSENIITELKSCVQGIRSKRSPKGIIDIIQDLKEKIEEIIYILSHIPTNIEELQNAINEIISHVNIKAVIRQLNREIDILIDEGGSNAKKCRNYANDLTEALESSSQDTTNKCLNEAEDGVEDIKSSIEPLTNEAQTILQDIKDTASQCFEDNRLNPVEIYKCLESHVDEFQKRVADLQVKITEAIEEGKDKAASITSTLATCMNKVRIDTIKQGQDILDDVQTCLLTSSRIYFK